MEAERELKTGKEVKENGTSAWVVHEDTVHPRKPPGEDRYLMGRIPDNLLGEIKSLDANQKKNVINFALNKTIQSLQERCKNLRGGTTLCGGFILEGQLYLFNVGDSLAFAQYSNNQFTSKPLNTLHSGSSGGEKKRIIAAGGNVFSGERVGNSELNLAVSRSIGPYAEGGKEYIKGVTWKPEIKPPISLKDIENLVFASDGIDKDIHAEPKDIKKYWQRYYQLPEVQNGTITLKQATTVMLNRKVDRIDEKGTRKESDSPMKKDDVTIVIVDKLNEKNGHFFGACDGHGGSESAEEVRNEFGNIFNKELSIAYGLEKDSQLNERHYQQVINPGNKPVHLSNDELLANAKTYLHELPKIYELLHPGTGKTSEKRKQVIDPLIERCKKIKTIQELMGEIINAYSDQQLYLDAKIKEMNQKQEISSQDYTDFLNSNKTDHHYMRLLGLLLNYLAENNVQPSKGSDQAWLGTNNDALFKIQPGERSIGANVGSFFKGTFFKKAEPPYEEALNLLKVDKQEVIAVKPDFPRDKYYI